jgi:8-oxo-dGTP diphosphatase
MQGYNVIMVYNRDEDQLLLCKRLKDPYKGLSNLVGGKIEAGEAGLEAAYRELEEETGITRNDIELRHVMDFTYYYQPCYVEVYAGRLKHDVSVSGEENELYWSDLNRNFFDMSLFAGEGNIGHMLEQVKLYRDQLFGE